ncbi:MAG TPA: 16S rRNA (guanine(527)-N(7))-methyltransferase RsmG [Aquabacterium sp.]|uniref:16S rRNA (guanine(527)-N(7))-methyltransferase RsmG n=1 Tax=Aquabacterium sp. TaxID=1872578 RepID=UPI002E36D8CE|nr:16S rRNA (guanine(527)-N(7))-methyltransferase RsmG [Aquabacterium sp.]HEX5358161.1 16S rRNA (guanine(527)-N(7))-methyltransferase RsmG [Aquabacterium sp.]
MSSQHKRGSQRGGVSTGAMGAKAAFGGGQTAAHRPKPAPARRAEAWTTEQWASALPPVLGSLNLALSAEQQQKLAAYMVLLSHWNSTFNLTALRDPQDMLTHHLTDCLTVLAPLGRHLDLVRAGRAAEAGAIRLLDVGSGGGLPGVVLAICCPDVLVTCVDTVGKKAAFIKQVAAELRLPNLRGEHARVEQLKGAFDLITSRAFASLLDFVSLTRAILADGAVWMAMKGKHPEDELAQLPADVEVFHVEQLQVPGLDAERCLVWMRPKG